MGVYDRQERRAKQKIRKKGQSVIWKQIFNGMPADATKPWKPSAGTTIEKPVRIAFFSLNTKTPRGVESFESFVPDTEIVAGRLYGIMATQSFTPNMKDAVVRDGVQYNVNWLDRIQVNEQTILYFVGLDK